MRYGCEASERKNPLGFSPLRSWLVKTNNTFIEVADMSVLQVLRAHVARKETMGATCWKRQWLLFVNTVRWSASVMGSEAQRRAQREVPCLFRVAQCVSSQADEVRLRRDIEA